MNIPFFNKKIEYMHPVTGERYYEKLGNIERRVVSHASKIFTLIEQSIEESVLQILEELKGPSAETGFLNSSAKEMKHFNIQDVKDLLFKMKQ